MINRTMVRTRVIQALYAYYKDGDKTPQRAKKDLLASFADTYSLYHLLLAFPMELTHYAALQIEEAAQKAKVSHLDYQPNYRFANSPLAELLFKNRQLRNALDNEHLSWDVAMNFVQSVYKQLVQSDFYQEYMAKAEITLDDDKKLWRKIYNEYLLGSEELNSALEELELTLDHQNWTVDAGVVLSFIIKTIKRFDDESNEDTELLPMFDKEDEVNFATKLLEYALAHHQEIEEAIIRHLHNWDKERVAYMDMIILQAAITELKEFPEIAKEVTMNEYLEIAKEYSGDKSHLFINGVLDSVARELREAMMRG